MKIIELNEAVPEWKSYSKHTKDHHEEDNVVDKNYPKYEVKLKPDKIYKQQKAKLPAEVKRGVEEFREENPRVEDAVVIVKKSSMENINNDIDEGLLKEAVEEEYSVRKIDFSKPFRTLEEIANGTSISDILENQDVEIIGDESEDDLDGEELSNNEDNFDNASTGLEISLDNPDNIEEIDDADMLNDIDDDDFVPVRNLNSLPEESDDDYMEPQQDDSIITQREWQMLNDADDEEPLNLEDKEKIEDEEDI